MTRNFMYVLSSFFLGEFGRAMYFLVITWVLYDMTKDPAYTGLLVGLGFLPGLFLNLFIGVVVDRLDRKKLAVGANLVITLAMVIVLLALVSETIQPWMVIGVHMLMQVTASLFRPAIQAFVAEAFEKQELPKVYSQSGSAVAIGALLGASLGGLIIAFLSMSTSMAIVVGCFVLSTITLLMIQRTKAPTPPGNKQVTVVTDFVDGFKYLKENTFLFGLFGVMFVGQLVFHTGVAFLSVYTQEFLKQPVTVYGTLDATVSVGGILAGIFGSWWWKKSGNSVGTYSLVIIALGLLCVGLAPWMPLSFFGMFLIGLGTTWVRVLLQSVQQMGTDPAFYGRMASYRMLCNQSAVAIGGPILGWIAGGYGIANAYLALLVPVLLTLVFSVFQAKQPRFSEITRSV